MDHPFQRWVDLAHPRAQLWRTLLGALLILVAWIAWSNVFVLLAVGMQLSTPDAMLSVAGSPVRPLGYLEAVMAMGVVMVTFWGLWLGVWLVGKWLHKRELSTVIAHDRRLRVDQFVIGLALAAGYLGVSTLVAIFSGVTPTRSGVPVDGWLIALAPMVLLILFQSAGEELVFRGYILQQLAARAPNPVVWGFLPSFVFGLIHFFNAGDDVQFGVYYVFAATMLGLVLTALVWRTGSLAAAMGFHLMNNIGAMLVFSVGGASPPISLYVFGYTEIAGAAPTDLLVLGLLLAFMLSPFAPLPKGQPLRRNVTRAAP